MRAVPARGPASLQSRARPAREERSMKYGVQMFPTDYAIPPHDLARACEDLGFESLFFPEHTHIPTSRRTPWPGGAPLPMEYSHTLDPFVAAGAAFAVTKN